MSHQFSAASVAADVASAAVAALEARGNERGLSEAELAQLAAFEALRAEACAAVPGSRSVYRHRGGRTVPFRDQLQRCAMATAAGMPLMDLLGMRGAVPADRHRLPLTIDTLLWLGVTRFADALALVCASGSSTAQRQQQLAAIRDLQGALGKVIRATLRPSSSDQDVERATARADAKFTRATDAIGDDLPAIRAEVAALRARRR